MLPAIDGLMLTLRVGAAVVGSPGRFTVACAWPEAADTAPDLLSDSFTPKGITGNMSSIASDSSLVSALATRSDWSTFSACTCQSTRASDFVGTTTCRGPV